MTTQSALVFGEVLIDEFPDRRVVAGAPLHLAVHLATMGWSTSLITRLGDDDDAAEILDVLDRFDVDTSHVETDPDLPTGTTTIELTGSDHSFTVNRPAAWDAISGPVPVPDADLLGFGTLAMRADRSRTALERLLRDSTAARIVDLNLRAPDFTAETIRFAIENADILKLNDEEHTEVANRLGIRAEPDDLHRLGPEWVCITRGAEGAALSHRGGGSWTTPAVPVKIVDTVGAGDAFCAALGNGLIRDVDPAQVLHDAAAIASQVAGRRGGLPPEPTA